jgi:hypothetical protein
MTERKASKSYFSSICKFYSTENEGAPIALVLSIIAIGFVGAYTYAGFQKVVYGRTWIDEAEENSKRQIDANEAKRVQDEAEYNELMQRWNRFVTDHPTFSQAIIDYHTIPTHPGRPRQDRSRL